MIRPKMQSVAIVMLCVSALLPTKTLAADDQHANTENIVAHEVPPLMAQYGIPGMAIGIVTNQDNHVYNYGTASKATGKPVITDTLFEIGSVSKTFTATLAAYAQITGHLSLSDPASKYLPSLRGSSFDKVTLLHLGTHTSGGLPLQVPDNITNTDQLIHYFQNWKPTYAPGTYRIYSNPSIGLLGMIAAKSMNGDFAELMEKNLFSPLGMKNTYLNVPNSQTENGLLSNVVDSGINQAASFWMPSS